MTKKILLLSISLALAGCGDLFCCSIFSWSSAEGRYLGTNEAWFGSPSYVLRFSPPENGLRGFVSLLHEGEGTIQGGMNDAGLSFDWVAGYESNWKKKRDRKTIEGQVSRFILERASTVEEAVAIFRAYDDPSFGVARMLIADATGDSAIIGWKDGDVVAIRARDSYQSLGFMEKRIDRELSRLQTPSVESFVGLLERAAQRGVSLRTSYSVVYDLEEKSFTVVDTLGTGKRFLYSLPDELAKGERTIRLRELFSRDDGEPTTVSAQAGHRWPDRGDVTVKLGAGYFTVPSPDRDEKKLMFPLPLASFEYERSGLTAFIGVLEGAGLRYRDEKTGLFVEASCGFGEMKDESDDGETESVNAPVRLNVKAGYGFDILTFSVKAEMRPSIIDGDTADIEYCGRYGASAGCVLAVGSFMVVPEVSAYLMNQAMANAWYSTDGANGFSASPGLEKVSGSLSARYAIGYHFSINALVLADLFLADAKRSPEVKAVQTSAGVFALYRL